MILPTVRQTFGRDDALHLVELVARADEDLRASVRKRLEAEGMDSLLDDPRVLNALLSDGEVNLTPAQIFYVLIRQALLEAGVEDRDTADYVASMVVQFGRGRRAYRIEDGAEDEFRYLVDMVVRLAACGEREAFLLRTHLGNYSLWITGLFPDFIEARVHRRGAPPVRYYEEMGAEGFRVASESREARSLGMERTLGAVALHFSGARRALNQVADRYLWREAGNPVARLLREVTRRVPEGN